MVEVKHGALGPFEHDTLACIQRLMDELDAIRQAGFAVSAGAVDPGVWGCSVPLFGASRQAVGAITLMAPILRSQGHEEALIRMTVVAAARISRQLVLH